LFLDAIVSINNFNMLRAATGRLFCFQVDLLGYNLPMNKKARKRLKESIQKSIATRTSDSKEQGSSIPPKKLPESRGFTARPDKKRG
jgi:hypothetical protein